MSFRSRDEEHNVILDVYRLVVFHVVLDWRPKNQQLLVEERRANPANNKEEGGMLLLCLQCPGRMHHPTRYRYEVRDKYIS